MTPQHVSNCQGDPGEPGFPGLSGLFGPKVLSLLTLCSMETKRYQDYFHGPNSTTGLLLETKEAAVLLVLQGRSHDVANVP